MEMTKEQAKIAFKLISKNSTKDEAVKMAKHLADLHNRRKTEENHARDLVVNMWKERFTTVLTKDEFLMLYYNFK